MEFKTQYGRPMKSSMCAVHATPSGSAVVAQTLSDQLLAVRYAGHLCEQRTLSRTRSRFYWPGMSGDVHLWCRTCTQCAARKRPSKNSRALMQPMTAGYPLQRVTDYFTKWTAAFPLTNMEADTEAKVLMEKYIAYFGAPDCLHSDQGRSFEARAARELCRLFDIKKTRSSPYHPKRNGQAERFSRTLLDLLSIMCEQNQQQWDEMLFFTMLAYNSSVNESTGVTPAIAMFGRELQLPLDIQMGSLQRNDKETLPNYIWQTRERIDIVHEQMRRQLKVQQRQQKSLYDRKAPQGTFCVNDLVWLAIPRGEKLHPCLE
ncbi:Retrovirus-related Pol polyprotein from transposon [Trichinella britovi]|uniref:RNA-directed DNA polymerase n=1 Tax=Trichinella britovi TaxID=45882 RepID=A0A0V1C5L6_TRIBR|nr:Retrovirus-related Pol polyprotein from transposon [Trichinella britovi]